MWGIKSVLGPHTSTHFPTSSPLPSPHPFPTRQHTSLLTPPLRTYLSLPPPTPHHISLHLPHTPIFLPTAPLTSPYTPTHFLFTPCTLPHLSPHILPHNFDYVAKLPSNSKSPIKIFTATGNLKSCFGVGNVNFRCMKVWQSFHVAKLLRRSYHVAKLLATKNVSLNCVPVYGTLPVAYVYCLHPQKSLQCNKTQAAFTLFEV